MGGAESLAQIVVHGGIPHQPGHERGMADGRGLDLPIAHRGTAACPPGAAAWKRGSGGLALHRRFVVAVALRLVCAPMGVCSGVRVRACRPHHRAAWPHGLSLRAHVVHSLTLVLLYNDFLLRFNAPFSGMTWLPPLPIGCLTAFLGPLTSLLS